MSVIRKMRRQKAVYWEKLPTPDRFGRSRFASPVEIDCRWDGRQEEFIDSQMARQVSRAVVYVDRIMKEGDMLAEITLDQIGSVSDEPEQNKAFVIRAFTTTPNFKATETLLTAYL